MQVTILREQFVHSQLSRLCQTLSRDHIPQDTPVKKLRKKMEEEEEQ
jgi:hypothetical protein